MGPLSRRRSPRFLATLGFVGVLVAACGDQAADTSATPRPTPSAPHPSAADPPEPDGATSTPAPEATGTGTPGTRPPGTASTVPSAQASAVFLGEACVPARDGGPQYGVNGLALYCVVDPAEGAAGRWATSPPPQPAEPAPAENAECEPEDVGRVVPDATGRPVTCLRDPDGGFRWSDVS